MRGMLAVWSSLMMLKCFARGTLARANGTGAAIGICVMCRGDNGQPSEKGRTRCGPVAEKWPPAPILLSAERFLGGESRRTTLIGNDARPEEVGRDITSSSGPSLVRPHRAGDITDHRAASALADAASWVSARHAAKKLVLAR